jgi:hypothetical protein
MLYSKDNRFIESSSPHSLGLKNNLTIPNPGWDQNPLLINEKKYWGATDNAGLSGLTFDGTGLFGTGLFSGDVSTWGVPEIIASGFGAYAVYSMFFQAKQHKYRLESKVRRSRVSRAAKYRRKAKELESREGLFGKKVATA